MGKYKIINSIGRFLKGVKNYFLSFFMSKGEPQPTYFWITLLVGIIVWMLVKYMKAVDIPSETIILGMCGFVATWLIVYNKIGKRKD
ncbi:MAG: hypothetical protein ACFFG0_02465 [Candidatus Thorarchaeota archaeon]